MKAQAQQQPSAASPGRKFLRRGQGTARFGKFKIKPPKKKSPSTKAEEKRATNEASDGDKIPVDDKPKHVEEGSAPGAKPVRKSQSKVSPQVG